MGWDPARYLKFEKERTRPCQDSDKNDGEYDVVSLDIWETTYIHLMPDADSIVEWYSATGLRHFLAAGVELGKLAIWRLRRLYRECRSTSI